MTTYVPDYWAILKIEGADPHYRVFATWAGSYTSGGHWRMNSGITKVEYNEPYYDFHGSTGSVYRCHEKMYGCHYANLGVMNGYCSLPEISLMPYDMDIINNDWILK